MLKMTNNLNKTRLEVEMKEKELKDIKEAEVFKLEDEIEDVKGDLLMVKDTERKHMLKGEEYVVQIIDVHKEKKDTGGRGIKDFLKYKIGFVLRIETGFQSYSRLDLDILDEIVSITKDSFNIEHIKFSQGEYIFLYCTEEPIEVDSFSNGNDANYKECIEFVEKELLGILNLNKESIEVTINPMYYSQEDFMIIINTDELEDDRTYLINDLYHTKMLERCWNDPQIKTKEILG